MIEISAQNFVFAMFFAAIFGAGLCMFIMKVGPYAMGWRDFTWNIHWTPANRAKAVHNSPIFKDEVR